VLGGGLSDVDLAPQFGSVPRNGSVANPASARRDGWSGRGGPRRDAKTLDTLCAEELSYSHARIEDKATFIKNATSDNSTFQSLEYKDPWIRVIGDAAIVRFHWVADARRSRKARKSPLTSTS
jgi:hypothetical protein